MALAGGVNLFLSPEGNIALSRSGMLSQSGACKAFDASADGFVRAEGAGVVVLRPLADALEEGNPIYAVIRGSGISTDGRDGGHMMAPGDTPFTRIFGPSSRASERVIIARPDLATQYSVCLRMGLSAWMSMIEHTLGS